MTTIKRKSITIDLESPDEIVWPINASFIAVTVWVKNEIAKLIEKAKLQAVSYDQLIRIKEGAPSEKPMDAGLWVKVPASYSAVYTHEEHVRGIMCRHLSFSSVRPGKIPNEHAMQHLMEEFGFNHSFAVLSRAATHESLPLVWAENYLLNGQQQTAINVMEPMTGGIEQLKGRL